MEPNGRTMKQLVYGGESYSEDDYELMLDKLDDFPRDAEPGCRRPSLYLQLFEDMINTVYEHEPHLLSPSEWDVFAVFKSYCYNARYCLIRLVLRKPDQWHAISALGGYKKEVGEVGLIRAITDLCRPWSEVVSSQPDTSTIPSTPPQEGVIDLSFDTDGDVTPPASIGSDPNMGPSNSVDGLFTSSQPELRSPAVSQSSLDGAESPFEAFCYDESSMSVLDLFGRLSVKQLQQLVRDTKVKPSRLTKLEMIQALLSHAATQSVLSCISSSSEENCREDEPTSSSNDTISGKGKERAVLQTQESRLIQMALQMLGKCIKVNSDFYRLVRRLHLICFRCTEHPTSLLLPALLTSFKKRSYPQYQHARDKTIWPTRKELLAYECALELEAALETIDSGSGKREPSTLTLDRYSVVSIGSGTNSPTRTPKKKVEAGPSRVGLEQEEELPDVSAEVQLNAAEEEEASIRKARKVKELLYEQIYPKWKLLIADKTKEGSVKRKSGLERFEPGYVYTRMLHHSVRSLATLKEYEAEYEILQALLGQRHYRRGSRARWYERRALIQMTYLCRTDEKKRDPEVLRQAMDGVKDALLDEDTGIVWRPGLVRRLQRLEKMLRVPEAEKVQNEGELKQPHRVFVKARRVASQAGSVTLESSKRMVKGEGDKKIFQKGLHAFFTQKRNVTETRVENVPVEKENCSAKTRLSSWKGKSLWIGKDNEEVHVETCALQHYETLGFKGFHAETRILTTIFSLLFWDVIFADVPGAFETPYQTAPLDLVEDTFYYTRKELIEERIEQIRDGYAREILEKHDQQHRDRQTFCIGLRWDICEATDLVEIVECLGGHTLSLICRLFCEDYGGRSSGVPDLVVWSTDQGICKFVEVKGPGDRPQENQKLWFDSLLRAGALVEICHVIDINAPPKEKRQETGKTRKRKALAAQLDLQHEVDHEEAYWGKDDDAWVPAGDNDPCDAVGIRPARKKRKQYSNDSAQDGLPGVSSGSAVIAGSLRDWAVPPYIGIPITDSTTKKEEGQEPVLPL
ncbi:hypothetical protein AMATHDRAFT_58424 [Amanita thiersii Skay4041]|uniref:Fanconi-associated nuclease n=1 Tax=Amanita thiersii Skay4041 TaxID=703135 RepID=A0A2A9NL20_9AGAR|nr:hypothetical protein AMATHDRAFT_58424 [Amanita thiersii Skay4041]